jgi:hypothetical protein
MTKTLPPSANQNHFPLPHEKILKAINTYPYLTTNQITRLLYSEGSLTRVRDHLRYLTEEGYLHRQRLPVSQGSGQAVYTLATLGRTYLIKNHVPVAFYYRPSEAAKSRSYLDHVIALNDTYLLFSLLAKQFPEVEILRFVHEREFKVNPPRVALTIKNKHTGNTRTITRSVIPDGYFQLSLPGHSSLSFALEVDRDTEHNPTAWQERIATYLAWLDTDNMEKMQATNLTVAVISTQGEKRLTELRDWTQKELERRNAWDCETFLFASLDPSRTSPLAFFFSPIWYRPKRQKETAEHVPSITEAYGLIEADSAPDPTIPLPLIEGVDLPHLSSLSPQRLDADIPQNRSRDY